MESNGFVCPEGISLPSSSVSVRNTLTVLAVVVSFQLLQRAYLLPISIHCFLTRTCQPVLHKPDSFSSSRSQINVSFLREAFPEHTKCYPSIPIIFLPSETIVSIRDCSKFIIISLFLAYLFLINHPPKTLQRKQTQCDNNSYHPQDLFFLLPFSDRTSWVKTLPTATWTSHPPLQLDLVTLRIIRLLVLDSFHLPWFWNGNGYSPMPNQFSKSSLF